VLIQTPVSLLCMQIGYQIVGTALEGMGGSALCGARVSMSLCRLDTYGWRVSEKHHLLFCALVVMCVRLIMATILYRTVQDLQETNVRVHGRPLGETVRGGPRRVVRWVKLRWVMF